MHALIRVVLISALALCAGPAGAQKTTEPQPMAAPGESTEPPRPSAAPVPVVQQHALPRGGGVLVFGGGEGTGLAVVKVLIADHSHVTVVTDDSSENAMLTAMGVTVAHGNVLDPETIKPIFTSAPFRAVISTIGEERAQQPLDFIGNKNIEDLAKASDIPRLILVSAIGAGDSADAPPWYVQVMTKVWGSGALTAKTQAEEYLRKSGLDYTVVRPGWISDRPASGKAVLTVDRGVYSQIARADLGNLVANCVDDDTTVGKTLSAFDQTHVGFLAILGWN